MNRILSSLSPFLLLMALTFVSSSCSKDSSTTGPNTSSTIATNLKVVTINASSVQVSWTRGSGDASTDTIFATTASGEIFQWLAPSSTSSLNLTGFQSGKVYTFTIHSIGGVSAGVSWSSICGPPTNVIVTTINSTSVQVTWARAIGDAGQDTAVALASTGESISVASASYTVTMTGLIVGKTYLITVHGLGGSSGAVTWPTGGSSNPATNLLVDALSSTSIGVRWTRASDDLTADTVWAISSVGDSSSVIASSSSSSAILTGLQGQKAYTITVHTSGGASAGMLWATADRYATVRLYETADPAPGHPSGLSLTPGAVTSLSVALVATQGLVDLSLATDLTVHGSNISLESAGVAGSGIPTGLRSVLLGDDAYIVRGGLDSDYYSGDLSTKFSSNNNAQDFTGALATTVVGGGDLIILVKTSTGHYGRLAILRQADGNLYTTDASGYHAIDVVVSLQAGPLTLPYASRGFRLPNSSMKQSNTNIIIAN
jgi:hypothetical protein